MVRINNENYQKKLSYSIITHGCQMNIHDSEKIRYILENLGYVKAEDYRNADFIVFNTCLVRENAELKLYGQIGSLKSLKDKNKDLIIAVCGCMMETELARKTIIEKYKQVDIIFGTKNISYLPALIDRARQNDGAVVDITIKDEIDNQLPMIRDSASSAYVNIMTGCNNFCTYCIVPYARGREESRSADSIIDEINQLVDNGYKEVILLGQNVNSYGNDLKKQSKIYDSFPGLLKRIDRETKIERLRFLTSHPKDVSDELIECMRSLPSLCKNLHLPFQSGSNRILKLMNRKYTKEHYLNIINKFKDNIPGITFSTDIIVGFPGETEEDFEDTIDVVRKVRFDQAYTFLYSKRPGTKAATMSDQIDETIKQDRFNRLLEDVYSIFKEQNRFYHDHILKVLVEGKSKNNPDMLTGRSDGYKLVNFRGSPQSIGKIVNVRITDSNSFALSGEEVKLC